MRLFSSLHFNNIVLMHESLEGRGGRCLRRARCLFEGLGFRVQGLGFRV